jgi:hypothetical protein
VVPLEQGRAVVIGRSGGADLVLDEELMSRRHARIAWEDGAPVVEDLRSTNGTFVNGLRVERSRLAQGDRIDVGASILKLVAEVVPVGLEEARALQAPGAGGPSDAAFQGRLEEVPLADLLQLLGATRKTGVLSLERGPDRGTVHVRGGTIVRCALAGHPELGTRDALGSLLGWTAGGFHLDPAAQPAPGAGQPVEALLIDALRVLDERAHHGASGGADRTASPGRPAPPDPFAE